MKRIGYLFLLTLLLPIAGLAHADPAAMPAYVQFRRVLVDPEWPMLNVVDRLGNRLYLDKELILDNDGISRAQVMADSWPGAHGIEIDLTDEARQELARFTKANVSKRVAVLLDGRLIDVVTIREPIDGGRCFIRNSETGPFSEGEARRIAAGLAMSPDLSTPEGMARAYFTALRHKGLAAVARFLHPEALARFQEILLPLFAEGSVSGNLVMAQEIFGKDATLESVRALPPREFMRIFLKTVARNKAGVEWNNLETLEVIGTVREGDVAHVLGRMQISSDGLTVKKIQVLSCKQDGTSWKPLLSMEVEQLALGLRRIVAEEAARN